MQITVDSFRVSGDLENEFFISKLLIVFAFAGFAELLMRTKLVW